MEQMVRKGMVPDAPEIAFAKHNQSRTALRMILLMVLGLVAGIWLAIDVIVPPPTKHHEEVPLRGTLIVQAPSGTYVVVNGRTIGISPNLGPVMLSPGTSNIEAMHDTHGKARAVITITADEVTHANVNWETKTITTGP